MQIENGAHCGAIWPPSIGAAATLTEEEELELASLHPQLWASSKYDVALIRDCEPVVITPKSAYRPRQAQYPLKPEAVDGIKPEFQALLQTGVIVPCPDSPVRTPIFPVKKPGRDEWRFVQDLQAVNAAVQARAPEVPNPHTILSQIPTDHTHYTVVDLANAFFSVPVHPDSRFWFAFSFEGKEYTFTCLCQGYCESPTIYNAALRDSMASLTLPEEVVLVQYVDDLLLSAPSRELCKQATQQLLQHLANNGHKTSKNKLQYCKPEVTFLGHIITAGQKRMAADRIQAICQTPKPMNKKQLLSFLGMCSYCHIIVIPSYAEKEGPLREIIPTKSTNTTRLQWTEQAEEAFTQLKIALQNMPALGIPDPTKPFVQMVDAKGIYMTSVLTQKHGDKLRPVAYFSCKLDPVARAYQFALEQWQQQKRL
ncbi:lactosylceramide alpha-2,3-sialyltransferase isoform X1 [Pygocentrus nattereri]|uniref:lactosylceramide alpha-2,3-sialyltransferase isoform X1 n=1 Tax=Pygocentrus nattereri TaxID=42514 RepID=UPI0018917FF7|nr:lactosylceramide alpha-2,3-sialyltransferase isoform X1 [Pygocentrus nattereri]XP_037396447.1 lactosylceramide alpha-2,3-sialyltransferase isoform X1 [Pygocentrus nattereri]